jgi:uncharacterized protein YndB with AHSA1/START domain
MTDTPFTPSPAQPIATERDGDRWTLVFVRELRHSPEVVWAALTDPAQLREWSPFRPDRALDTRGDATFTMVDGDDEEDTEASIQVADAPRVLQYDWAGDLLRWELEPTGAGTRLTLRHTVQSEEWVPRVAAGWHLCLDVADLLMGGEHVDPVVGRAARANGGDELRAAYAAQLGVPDPGRPDGVNVD